MAGTGCSGRNIPSIHTTAGKLAKKAKVASRVLELRSVDMKETVASILERKEFLTNVIRGDADDVNFKGNPVPAGLAEKRQASDQLNRMESVYVERSESRSFSLTAKVDLKDYSLEDLKALIGKMETTDKGHSVEAEATE